MTSSPARAPARGRVTSWRTNGRLIAASVLLGALLAANVAAFYLPDEFMRLEFKGEPSHVAWLQRLTWSNPARDMVVSTNVFDTPSGPDTTQRVFRSIPIATARVGRRYEYRPATATPLTNFTLDSAPPGLTVDAKTGVVSGTPTTAGKYEVVLSGEKDASHSAKLRFPLFVDTRFLLLGSNGEGKDVANQLLLSMKYTIVPGCIAVVISVGLGTLLGALAGFYAGASRRILRGASTVIQSIPGLLLVFFAAVISGFNVYEEMIMVGIILIPETANGVYERVAKFRERDFVEAARELGMSDRAILWNEIVWHNVRRFLLTRVAQAFTFAVLVEVTLSFIGLADATTARLGVMLKTARDTDTPLRTLAPIAAVLLIMATFSLMERGVGGLWERRR